jgi:uncharacterized protein
LEWVFLGGVGLFVGAFGTLIGVAGGFLLVPVLFYLYPDRSPSSITAITLTVAFFNSLSGTLAYWRLRRIDIRSALAFSAAAVPGALIGGVLAGHISRRPFQTAFGVLLLLLAIYLTLRPLRSKSGVKGSGTNATGLATRMPFRPAGIVIAFFVGIVSGLFGIGGGIIHVPALTQVLGFPVYVATATSQFVVGTSTFAAGLLRLFSGAFAGLAGETVVLSACAVAGAQVGARLSHRVPERVIVWLLAAALAIVSVRMLFFST